MGKCDDLKLCRRAAAGDKSALSAIYSRYGDLLFAFIYHRVARSVPDTEEIWHETWLAALWTLSTYRGRSAFFTWLGSIARHKIADYYRRRGREPVECFSSVSEQDLARLIYDGPLPEEILMQQATRACVVHALASLPDEYRTALVARYADGRSVNEVGQKLGKSYKATESLLSRAAGDWPAWYASHVRGQFRQGVGMPMKPKPDGLIVGDLDGSTRFVKWDKLTPANHEGQYIVYYDKSM